MARDYEAEARMALAQAHEDEGSPDLVVREIRSGKHDTRADRIAIRVIAAALARPALPDGWVAVPRAPTVAMLEAGDEAGFGFIDGEWILTPSDCYTAMLAAAPAAGSEVGNG